MIPIDFSDRVALIAGVANKRSIAWSIAKALDEAGAQIVLTHLDDERITQNIEKLATQLTDPMLVPCDVTDDEQLQRAYEQIDEQFGQLDALVHSVAFAPREEFDHRFVETTRGGFRTSLEVSAYSLLPMARHAEPLMEKAGGGSIVAMTYLAAVRATPTYNVMGTAKAALEQIIRQLAYELGPQAIRVNGISAGPVSTLSARGIPGFTDFLKQYEDRAALKRNITPEEVGQTGVFLLSDLASGITGEILYVDAGYHMMAF